MEFGLNMVVAEKVMDASLRLINAPYVQEGEKMNRQDDAGM